MDSSDASCSLTVTIVVLQLEEDSSDSDPDESDDSGDDKLKRITHPTDAAFRTWLAIAWRSPRVGFDATHSGISGC